MQRDWLEKDYYKILGVSSGSSKDEIKRAYRKLAQRYHPDANKGDPGAEQRFKEISEAYSVLSNDDKRKEYDQIRSYAQNGRVPFGFRPGGQRQNVRVDVGDVFSESGLGDLFEEVFGFGSRARKGRDVETETRLSFMDAFRGTMVELADGTKVRIPPGVKDGTRIRVPGKGEAAPGGGRPGDLYVRIHVAPDPVFKLDGKGNVLLTLPITYPEAVLGATVQVPTPEGTVNVKVPSGARSGSVLRVKGMGVPGRSGTRGDLLVTLEIAVPQRVSKREREFLEELGRLQPSPRQRLEDLARAGQERAAAGTK